MLNNQDLRTNFRIIDTKISRTGDQGWDPEFHQVLSSQAMQVHLAKKLVFLAPF